jgi:CRP-like cAMP-binding protein
MMAEESDERCVCNHALAAHGFRGQPGCTFCSCEQFRRPNVVRQKVELTRLASRAVDLLSHRPEFKGIPHEALELFAVDGRGRMYPPDTEIVPRGSNSHVLCVVISGSVILQADPGSKPIEMGPGEIAGDLRAFSGEERWASITSAESVEILEVNTTKLRQLFADQPDLFDRMMQLMSRYAESADELVEATLGMALEQFSAGVAAEEKQHRGGLDPAKAQAIIARWREIKDQDHEDRAQAAARAAIDAHTKGRR